MTSLAKRWAPTIACLDHALPFRFRRLLSSAAYLRQKPPPYRRPPPLPPRHEADLEQENAGGTNPIWGRARGGGCCSWRENLPRAPRERGELGEAQNLLCTGEGNRNSARWLSVPRGEVTILRNLPSRHSRSQIHFAEQDTYRLQVEKKTKRNLQGPGRVGGEPYLEAPW